MPFLPNPHYLRILSDFPKSFKFLNPFTWFHGRRGFYPDFLQSPSNRAVDTGIGPHSAGDPLTANAFTGLKNWEEGLQNWLDMSKKFEARPPSEWSKIYTEGEPRLGYIKPVYLDVNNPIVFRDESSHYNSINNYLSDNFPELFEQIKGNQFNATKEAGIVRQEIADAWRGSLQKRGIDAILYGNGGEPPLLNWSVIALNPKQISSALRPEIQIPPFKISPEQQKLGDLFKAINNAIGERISNPKVPFGSYGRSTAIPFRMIEYKSANGAPLSEITRLLRELFVKGHKNFNSSWDNFDTAFQNSNHSDFIGWLTALANQRE